MSHRYLTEKWSEMLRRMHSHPGNANARLAAQWAEIILLSTHMKELQMDKAHQREWVKLLALVQTNAKNNVGIDAPKKIGNIRNLTAVKYIKLLMMIEVVYIEQANYYREKKST